MNRYKVFKIMVPIIVLKKITSRDKLFLNNNNKMNHYNKIKINYYKIPILYKNYKNNPLKIT